MARACRQVVAGRPRQGGPSAQWQRSQPTVCLSVVGKHLSVTVTGLMSSRRPSKLQVSPSTAVYRQGSWPDVYRLYIESAKRQRFPPMLL